MLNQLLFPNPYIEGKNLYILRKIALISFYRDLLLQSEFKKIISLQPFLPKISIFSSKNFLPLHLPQTSWPQSINVSCISYRNK